MSRNLTKEEKVEWILENCIDEVGNIDLSNLDFSDFDGDVVICDLRIKNNLYQNGQEVQGDLSQNWQKVKGDLHQNYQKVQGDLYQ